MSKVSITKSKLDNLAISISTKSGATLPLTLDGMKTAVDNMSGGGSTLTTKSITANGTYNASDDSADGYSQVTVSISPTLQSKSVSYTPTESSQSATVSADNGYDGLSSVDISVGAISSTYIGSDITQNPTPTVSGATVTIPKGYYSSNTSKSVSSGTAGTPSASKGTVNNHSITVTPSVTNTTGYITGGTKTGTGVSVSASELVSGSQTITGNSTVDVTNLAEVVVNVSGGSSMNAQTAQSTTRSASTTYTDIISLTCEVAGTYDVYWSTFRSSTSGTWGSRLYLNNTAYGSAQTGSWSNHIQNIKLTGVSISAGADVAVRVRTRGSNYYGYVGTLTIIQTS